MPVQISIRNVPEEVRDRLRARAASRGQSLQEHLRRELERIVSYPTREAWLEGVRRRTAASKSRVTTEDILEALDRGRG